MPTPSSGFTPEFCSSMATRSCCILCAIAASPQDLPKRSSLSALSRHGVQQSQQQDEHPHARWPPPAAAVRQQHRARAAWRHLRGRSRRSKAAAFDGTAFGIISGTMLPARLDLLPGISRSSPLLDSASLPPKRRDWRGWGALGRWGPSTHAPSALVEPRIAVWTSSTLHRRPSRAQHATIGPTRPVGWEHHLLTRSPQTPPLWCIRRQRPLGGSLVAFSACAESAPATRSPLALPTSPRAEPCECPVLHQRDTCC
jgi:hypothetical protein